MDGLAERFGLLHNAPLNLEIKMSSEEYKEKMREMFEPCMSRADLKDHIEIVSLEWLLEMSNPEPSEMVSLGADRPGQEVAMADFAKDIKRRRLQEPLVVTVGMATGRARLEAGNHRARILLDLGFLHAPAVCWVGASHVGFEENGQHQGREVKFWPQAKPLVAFGVYDERYFEKPSSILPSAPVLGLAEQQRPARSKAPPPAPKPPERKARAPRQPAAEPAGVKAEQERAPFKAEDAGRLEEGRENPSEVGFDLSLLSGDER